MRLTIFLLVFLVILLPMYAGAEEVQRVLLMGTDRQGYAYDGSYDESMSRADVILLVAIKSGSPDIRVLNVERDYLVQLPDEIGPNKLATATYFGGPEMLMDAVNEMLDLDIRLFIQTDIGSIPKIIDSIGGVDVEVLEEDILGFGKTYFVEPVLFKGINHFNGPQAQNFIRFRDNDIAPVESNMQRNERHLRVISALLDKLTLLSLKDVGKILMDISSLIQTNLSLSDLLSLAQDVSKLDGSREQLQFMHSPSGAYATKRMNMHFVIIAKDMQEEQRMVREFLMYPSE